MPHDRTARTLVVAATLERVRILDADTVVADHPRSFDHGQQIEDPRHVEALVAAKRAARAHRAQDRLHVAAPSTAALFRAAAARGHHLGVLTRGLLRLLDAHGATALDAAITEAIARDTPSLGTVRQLLDQHRHQRGLPPALPLALPDDPRLRALHVRPHDLADYDHLQEDPDDERNVPNTPRQGHQESVLFPVTAAHVAGACGLDLRRGGRG